MKKIVMLGMLVFGFTLAASAQTDKPAAEKTKSCCKSKAAGETKADCHKVEGATGEAKACCKSKTASTEAKACCKSKKDGAKCETKHEASEKKHHCADHKEN